MKKNIINLLVCSACHSNFEFFIHKETPERIINGELQCKKCQKKFNIINEISCFIPPKKQIAEVTSIETRRTKKTTLKDKILSEILPREWKQLFSKQEFLALRKEWDWMFSVIKKAEDAIHLDLATGTGMFLRKLVFKTKGDVVTIDFGYPICVELQYFLKKIKKYNRISIVCADAREMPFKDGIFDSVSSWHGLDEPKMEKVIKEARRVLKDGGYFTASGVHYQRGSKSFSIAKKHNIQFTTKEAIMQALEKTGFRKIEYKRFFEGKWNEKGSYLPVIGDSYSIYAIRVKK